jgi:LytS/YehU family sensor histidine kinase
MVQSSATNHFMGAKTAAFAFTITPPFYKTLWFFLLLAVSLGSLIFWFISIREKRLKAREKAEKDKIKFQLDTLKNQVNPHFLFNSFNTLIGVIEEDKETAVEYVEKLSDFYRNILVNRERDLITLSKELEMLDDYYFLQLKRFKKNFNLNVKIPDDKLGHSIPPLTLQLLVENALKHNIVSNERPLIIDISVENDYLVVRNNLQRKTVYESSTGMGLSNIKDRFKLLTSKNVVIHETPEYFVVYIPLLDVKE